MRALFVTALIAFLPSFAEASQRTIEFIDRALAITNVELQAVYSGRYTHYRPDTIRRVLGQLQSETMHSGDGNFGGHRPCQPPSRVGCLN